MSMEEDNNNEHTQPLLTPLHRQQQQQQHDHHHTHSHHLPLDSSTAAAVFTAESHDIPPIAGAGDFTREFLIESKKLWYLAGPAIFTSICQYSLGSITQVFAGHVGTLQLAAVSVENSVIAGFCLGITVITLTLTTPPPHTHNE